ncbi:MAG: alpha-glucosidase C-terminal domain-containing protein, partial [Bacteroidota bacterium]
LMPRMYMSVKLEDRHPITDIFDQTPAIPENCQWATFLRNHDELTLEMVTEEERDFMNNAYAADERARINVGIRRRLAPLMENDHNKIKLLNVLLMSLPGTPVLYYGDEIGMGDNIYLKDRDGVRTPMQWDNGLNAGFSEANPHSLYMPVIHDTEYSYEWINVKRQEANPNSLLNWTKKLLNTRTEYKVFGRGSMTFLKPDNSHILAFVRVYEQEKILVVINLSRHAQSTQLDLSDYASHSAHEVFGRSRFANIEDGPYKLSLSAHGYYWLKLEEIDTSRDDRRNLSTPTLNSADFAGIFSKRGNRKLLTNKALPAYLKNVSWMGTRADRLEYVSLVDTRVQYAGPRTYGWLLLRLHYLEGMDELVQLPLAFFAGEAEVEQEAKICLVSVGGETYTVVDGLYDPAYRAGLLKGLAAFGGLPGIVFSARQELEAAAGQEVDLHHNGTEYALLRSAAIYLKYYRRVARKTVPDLEMKAWLGKREFPHTHKLLGSLHYQPDLKSNATLAIYELRSLQEETLASAFVLDQLRQSASSILDKLGQTEELETPLNISLLRSISDLGQMLANFHALTHLEQADGFTTEALSLHYQRSVYAGLKSDVRATMDLLKSNLSSLDGDTTGLAEAILAQEQTIHDKLQRIYRHKIEADKIRIHGDFTLEQVTINDERFTILNFDGDPDRPFSQRRLRRSPAKDLANLMQSIGYASGLVLEELSAEHNDDQAD